MVVDGDKYSETNEPSLHKEPMFTKGNIILEDPKGKKCNLLSFHEAVHSNDLQRITHLLKSGIDCNTQDDRTGNTALMAATVTGLVDVVRALLPAKADVNLYNTKGTTVLHMCVRNEIFQPEIAALFLRHEKSNFNLKELESGNTPLHVLAETSISDDNKRGKAIVNILSEMISRCKPNTRNKTGNTALHIVCEGGKDNTDVEAIILSATDVNTRNRLGEIPLATAIKNRKYTLAMEIVERSTNFELRDKCGYTPLHHASECDAPQVMNRLLEKGCDINAKDFNGNTPLHLATGKGHSRIVEELLKWDWDLRINMQNDIGYTPLMCAVHGGFARVVRLLLKWKCDVTVISHQTNKTALDIAKVRKKTKRRECCEVYEIIAKYMTHTLRLTLMSTDSI